MSAFIEKIVFFPGTYFSVTIRNDLAQNLLACSGRIVDETFILGLSVPPIGQLKH